LETLRIRKRRDNYIQKGKIKREGMFVMKENDRSKSGEEKTEGQTISKPEDQIYQKLYLCDYLRELYEAAEEESEHLGGKKKKLQTPAK
jgi:hypothetical protein